MTGAQHLDAPRAEREGLPDLEGHEAQYRVLDGGQAREVGPQPVVEEIGAQHVDRGLQRVDLDRPCAACLAAAQHAVCEQGHAQHMIEVRVREQDVVDARERVEREVVDACAGV